eukprot:10765852-Lingulodinium_polyedra.AAC.1
MVSLHTLRPPISLRRTHPRRKCVTFANCAHPGDKRRAPPIKGQQPAATLVIQRGDPPAPAVGRGPPGGAAR